MSVHCAYNFRIITGRDWQDAIAQARRTPNKVRQQIRAMIKTEHLPDGSTRYSKDGKGIELWRGASTDDRAFARQLLTAETDQKHGNRIAIASTNDDASNVACPIPSK